MSPATRHGRWRQGVRPVCARTTGRPCRDARAGHAGARGEARGARLGRAGVPATLIAAMVETMPTTTRASLLSAPLIWRGIG